MSFEVKFAYWHVQVEVDTTDANGMRSVVGKTQNCWQTAQA